MAKKTAEGSTMLHMLIDPALLKRVDDFLLRRNSPRELKPMRWLLDAALKAKLAPKETE